MRTSSARRRLAMALAVAVAATGLAASSGAVATVSFRPGTYTAKIGSLQTDQGALPKFPVSFTLARSGAVSDLKIGPLKLECDSSTASEVKTIAQLKGFPTLKHAGGFLNQMFEYRSGHWKLATNPSTTAPTVAFRYVYGAGKKSANFHDNGGGIPPLQITLHVTAAGRLADGGAYGCAVSGAPVFTLR